MSRREWLGLVPVWAAGAAMLAWSWGTWPNVLVDFGREVYVPWRLVEGDALYVDIAYFNGPFSPYLNALFFRVFGVGIHTLVLANLALLIGLTVLLHTLLVRISDGFSATCAGIVFASVFAFSQLDPIGNDNYLTPYSHEITHGLVIALAGIFATWRWQTRPMLSAAVGGFALGVVFLTKAEVFIAAAAALALAAVLPTWIEKGRPQTKVLLSFAGASALAPLAAVMALAQTMPAREAWRGTLGTWRWTFDPELTSSHFYRLMMGTLDTWGSLATLVNWSAVWVALLAFATLLAFVANSWARGARAGGEIPDAEAQLAPGALLRPAPLASALACFLLASALDSWWVDPTRLDPWWVDATRPLPVAIGALLAFSSLRLGRDARGRRCDEVELLRFLLLLFAFLLLLKIVLSVRLIGYGFALAMPAALLGVTWLLTTLPRWIAASGGSPAVARASLVGFLVAGCLSLTSHSGLYFEVQDQPVASGPDAFRSDGRGTLVTALLEELDARAADGETLVVLPEGVMVNYLSRRVNPTPYINFMPPELIMFGEEEMVASLEEAAPEWVVLVHKNTAEYGVPFFGRDYGRALHTWARRNYRPVRTFGQRPFQQNDRFGMVLMRRVGSESP